MIIDSTDPAPGPRVPLALVPEPPPWQTFANCRGCDPELFFPTRGETTKEARAVCAGCVVREPCLDEALARNEQWGIWGGMSRRERMRLRRQQRRAAS